METIRMKLSKNSKYYLEKHRRYELKHFCLQYHTWKKIYLETDGYNDTVTDDPTYECAAKRLSYFKKMDIVEQAAIAADSDIASYILEGVTRGYSYNALKTRYEIPCCKEFYYDRCRKFFWLLDKSRE